MKNHFAPGDKVRFLWGLDYAEGTIEEIYGPPSRPVARVLVTIPGPKGETVGQESLPIPLDGIEHLPRHKAAN